MWLTRRNRQQSPRSRRASLAVELLEKRELLSGNPMPAPTHAPPPAAYGPAVPSPIAEIPADTLLPGHGLPANVLGEQTSNTAGPAWASAAQPPALAGAAQKPPTNSTPQMQVPLLFGPNQSSSPAGEGYTPAQMQQAYGFDQIPLPAGETFNDAGSGQTIAIIDAFNDPYIASDVQTFDQTFNIGGAANNPANTGFLKVVNEYGGSALPPTDDGQVDYGLETSLDVEWAHAMAPGANILLIEADSSNFNDLGTAIEYAAQQPGVSVVSMSFGSGEWGTEYYLDNIFTTPLGHAGVAFVASAGDYSSSYQEYPAMSPNVLSVGGTTLPADAAGNPDRALEYAWSDGGGGVSYVEAEPAYQLGVQSTGSRTGPDLAYDADLSTGVVVYDTLFANANAPGEPWIEIGGTSMGAPQVSAMVAIADQQRVAAGEGTLDGANQLLPAIYQIAATDPRAFQDITSGNNGYAAGPGYDEATGLGTPNAQYLVPDLVAVDPTPAAPTTLYWTGDVNNNWDSRGNWSTVDPAVENVPQSILPTPSSNVVIDLAGATVLHDTANYDTIRSLTVTAPNVTLDLGSGTLDLSGSGQRGTFQVDQPGDAVTMEAGILANADVTAGTTISASSGIYYQEYPELAGVELAGALNVNQAGGNNGIVFSGGLILNGTINLGGTSDQSAMLLAGYADDYVGNQDNNPETISGTGTILLGQSVDGDAIDNWGTLATFTIGSGITVIGGGPGSDALFGQTGNTGGLDNQGTLEANGGTFGIEAFGPVASGPGTTTTTSWTNEGTIDATDGTTLELYGSWINYGTIRVDSTSTLFLGDPTFGELPSSANAVYDTWSSVGSLVIGNGATVYVGGFLTTDEYQGAVTIPGVTVTPALDTFFLDGTLDNTAADNAVSHGVLTLSAATGPLELLGGTIDGGSIVTSGSDDVEAPTATVSPYGATGGWLYNVTNDGTIGATGTLLTLQNVINNGTVDGTEAELSFLGTWANFGTIRVDAASTLDLGSPADSDPAFPPTLADASAYAWNLNAVGTITVANGATVAFGGLLTSDQFAALPDLPGVSIDLAQDTIILDAWLDNTPADNPVHGGVLTASALTGALHLAGGIVFGGTIVSTAADPVLVGGVGGVLDNVTNNGTIDAFNEYTFLTLVGNIVNNGTLANSDTSIVSQPGTSLVNNGTVSITYGGVVIEGSVTNNGIVTTAQGILEVTPANPTQGLTNTGTITLSPGTLYVVGNTTNSGTITASDGSVELYGTYDNSHGTISIDSTSGMILGYSPILQQNFPTFADGKPYTFNPSKVGTLKIADGATFDIGGLITTDQWNAFPKLPGVSIDVTKDQIYLAGWLDNSPADNPKSHGVLALNATTGPLYLNAGYIYEGKITTSGPNDLEGSSLGELDDVELDGNLNVTGPYGFGEIYAVNNLKLNNGTIEMPEGSGELLLGYFDNATDTITGTGTISMGTANTYEGVVVDLSNVGLTIGSGITIDAGSSYADLVSEVSQINVEGTVVDDTAGSTLYTYGQNQVNYGLFQDLANDNNGTLTGGTWEFSNGATWRLDGGDLTTNAANLSLSGAGTQVLDSIFEQGSNVLAGLTTNAAAGNLTIGAGYSFAPASFTNAGILNIPSGASLAVPGAYTQTAGAALDIGIASPAAYGQLMVGGTATLAGALNVALAGGYTPAPGAAFPILTFAAHSGNFGSTAGLTINKSEFFVPSYVGNDLMLIVGPCVSVVDGTNLYIVGGQASNDQVQVKPIGSSNTGSTGVQVTATLGGTASTTSFTQDFATIDIVGFAGNDTIGLAPTLTIAANISAGNGNDLVTAGNGNTTIVLGNGNDVVVAGNGANTITLGNGNDLVGAGNGNNTVSLGNGNDGTALANGNNVVVEGNGNDAIAVGGGDNLIVAGLGQHTVLAGNGSNILIDGSVKLTESGDSLQQVLSDWATSGSAAAAGIRTRLAVTYNSSHANVLLAGNGLDWFWENYAKDVTNRKATDLLN